jgi:hypothetical protein
LSRTSAGTSTASAAYFFSSTKSMLHVVEEQGFWIIKLHNKFVDEMVELHWSGMLDMLFDK